MKQTRKEEPGNRIYRTTWLTNRNPNFQNQKTKTEIARNSLGEKAEETGAALADLIPREKERTELKVDDETQKAENQLLPI